MAWTAFFTAGKTVEIAALILANPYMDRQLSTTTTTGSAPHEIAVTPDAVKRHRSAISASSASRALPTKATLIIVPPAIMNQWWRELHSKIAGAELVAPEYSRNVPKTFTVVHLDEHIDAKKYKNRKYEEVINDCRRMADDLHAKPSSWGCEHDGSALSLQIHQSVELRVPGYWDPSKVMQYYWYTLVFVVQLPSYFCCILLLCLSVYISLDFDRCHLFNLCY